MLQTRSCYVDESGDGALFASKGQADYGVYYTQQKPIDRASLEWRKQIK